MTSVKSDGKYLAIQAIAYLTFPIISFALAIANYKKGVSQIFFILFAFYFGWQIDCVLDLENHYENFRTYFIGHSLSEIFSNVNVYDIGKEPYHIVIKYIIGCVSDNSHFFAGCAASIYAIVFVAFLRQFKQFYTKRQQRMQFLVLCCVVFTVEYYWYLGFRYWTGAFFFLTFFLKYINTRRRKYLLISFCAILFHAAHGIAIVAVLLALLLKHRRKTLYAIAIVSMVMRTTGNWMYVVLGKIPILKIFVKDSYYDSGIQTSIEERGAFFRSEGNIVYQYRPDILFGVAVFVLFLLWRKNKKLNDTYPLFFAMLLLLFSITNFLYMDFVAYDRTYKMLIVMLFSYLYLLLQEKKNLWINKKLLLVSLLFLVVVFALLTAVIQQREYLADLSIWFGSIWSL